MIISRGRGIQVHDAEGRGFSDGIGLWCASPGFSDERLIAAATGQLATLRYHHGFAHKTADVASEIAHAFCGSCQIAAARCGSSACPVSGKLAPPSSAGCRK